MKESSTNKLVTSTWVDHVEKWEMINWQREQMPIKCPLGAQGGYIEPLQENCTNKSIRKKSQNINKNELRCVCLNARSIIKTKVT